LLGRTALQTGFHGLTFTTWHAAPMYCTVQLSLSQNGLMLADPIRAYQRSQLERASVMMRRKLDFHLKRTSDSAANPTQYQRHGAPIRLVHPLLLSLPLISTFAAAADGRIPPKALPQGNLRNVFFFPFTDWLSFTLRT
jgi:hypothetical protein